MTESTGCPDSPQAIPAAHAILIVGQQQAIDRWYDFRLALTPPAPARASSCAAIMDMKQSQDTAIFFPEAKLQQPVVRFQISSRIPNLNAEHPVVYVGPQRLAYRRYVWNVGVEKTWQSLK